MNYQKPELEILQLENKDVVTNSFGEGNEEGKVTAPPGSWG